MAEGAGVYGGVDGGAVHFAEGAGAYAGSGAGAGATARPYRQRKECSSQDETQKGLVLHYPREMGLVRYPSTPKPVRL